MSMFHVHGLSCTRRCRHGRRYFSVLVVIALQLCNKTDVVNYNVILFTMYVYRYFCANHLPADRGACGDE